MNKYQNIIGNIYTVIIDRPLGSYHPHHHNIYYPVNYGYIKGIIALDNEEQDVYILGVDKPLTSFTGKIIGVIHRLDDCEDKWVMAPEGMDFSVEEIKEQTNFQEQYFKIEIIK